MGVEVADGLLLNQRVDAIVLSCSLPTTNDFFERAGREPFDELAARMPISPGQAVLTGAGALPFKGILHVADFDASGRTSETLIELAVKNAIHIVEESNFWSVAFPILGAGELHECDALARMLLTLHELKVMGTVVVARGRPSAT